jgi:hypothetical protein
MFSTRAWMHLCARRSTPPSILDRGRKKGLQEYRDEGGAALRGFIDPPDIPIHLIDNALQPFDLRVLERYLP